MSSSWFNIKIIGIFVYYRKNFCCSKENKSHMISSTSIRNCNWGNKSSTHARHQLIQCIHMKQKNAMCFSVDVAPLDMM